MKPTITLLALLAVLTSCTTTSTAPHPEPTLTPREAAEAILFKEVDGLTPATLETLSADACELLDKTPADTTAAVTTLAIQSLNRGDYATIIELQTAAGLIVGYAAGFDCTTHRETVNEWLRTRP